MKTNYNLIMTLAASLMLSASAWSQVTIAQWNFNGSSNTTIPGGENAPTVASGMGTAMLVGGTTATFANGSTATGTAETETTSPPNYGWNTTNYPASGTGNKTAGVQFNVNTTGFTGVNFYFEQRLSNTSANTYVVQYTTNRLASPVVWVDSQTFTFTPMEVGTGDTWYIRSVDFSPITALNNNPNVAFRVVSAFDPGTGNYLAARSTSTYAGGTVRFDMVRITAQSLGIGDHNAERTVFTISPNPTRNQVVQFNETQDITVFDITGKLIHSAKNASSLDPRSYNPGVYMIKTGSGVTKKLIVE